MPEEISDDELDALLAARHQRPGDGDQEQFSRTPLAYDFRRPQRISKDQMRGVENLHEQFARALAASLATTMRLVVDVDVAFIDQVLYGEFVPSLNSPCCAYTFAMAPPAGNALLCLSNELVFAIIDRAFGGKGMSTIGDPRPLTPIESKVINKVATRIFQDLETAWEPIVPVRVSDITLETNPEFIQLTSANEPLLLVAFEASSGTASGLIHLAYPMAVFDPLLQRMAPGTRQRERQARQGGKGRPVAIDKVQVAVTAQIARGSLPLRDLALLQPGDVIRLDTASSDPAIVFVGDQPKFLAQAGLDGKRRAVKITRTIHPDEEDAYR